MRKKLFIFWGICLTILGCQSSHPDKIIVQGHVNLPNSYKISLQSNQENQPLKADSLTHTYSIELDNAAAGFLKLQGVVEDPDGPWPFAQDLYGLPGATIQVNLEAEKRKMKVSTASTDKNNSVLVAYNQFYLQHSYDLWSNTPPANQAKTFLQKFTDQATQLSEQRGLAGAVKKYLQIKSYLDYVLGIGHFAFIYRQDGTDKLPEDINDNLPAIETVLDDSLALLFMADVQQIIYQYLDKQSKQPEEQLTLLQEKFTLPAIREKMISYILEGYVQEYPYSRDFENGLSRLKQMCASLPDKGEKYIRDFEAKRHTIVGSPLPDATLETPDGRTCKLSDLKGSPLYIDLWASWCVPCCKEVPNLQKLEKEMKNKSVKFISISIDENKKAWKERMKQLHMEGNQYIVVGQELNNMLNVQSIPHFLIYDKDGRLIQYKAPRPSQGEEVKEILNGLKSSSISSANRP